MINEMGFSFFPTSITLGFFETKGYSHYWFWGRVYCIWLTFFAM